MRSPSLTINSFPVGTHTKNKFTTERKICTFRCHVLYYNTIYLRIRTKRDFSREKQ